MCAHCFMICARYNGFEENSGINHGELLGNIASPMLLDSTETDIVLSVNITDINESQLVVDSNELSLYVSLWQ